MIILKPFTCPSQALLEATQRQERAPFTPLPQDPGARRMFMESFFFSFFKHRTLF